jgi:hypothetical protein
MFADLKFRDQYYLSGRNCQGIGNFAPGASKKGDRTEYQT